MISNKLKNHKISTMAVLATTTLAVTATFAMSQPVSAATKPLQMRYFEAYTSNGALDDDNDDKYVYKIGYVDNSGKSRRVTKTAAHVNEYVSDTGKATVSDNGFGKSAEVVRPPYQAFDVNVKSNKVITMGWTDFIKAHPKIKNSTVKIKWHEVINNPQIGDSDHPSVTVLEFAYNHQLYRMYMTYDSNGMNSYQEDVSPEFTTPTLKFDSHGNMTYQRAPYNMYTQNAQSGTVTEK